MSLCSSKKVKRINLRGKRIRINKYSVSTFVACYIVYRHFINYSWKMRKKIYFVLFCFFSILSHKKFMTSSSIHVCECIIDVVFHANHLTILRCVCEGRFQFSNAILSPILLILLKILNTHFYFSL
jgi:hypothetical protein